MYHFIRRFFVFILVLASIFSLLLCSSQRPYAQMSPMPEPPDFLDYGAELSHVADYGEVMKHGVRPNDYGWIGFAHVGMGYVGSGLLSTFNIEQQLFGWSLQQGAVIPSSDLMYTMPIGQTLFSGSQVKLMDRIGHAISQQSTNIYPNLVSQSYIPAVATGAYGFASPGRDTFSLPSSSPWFLTSGHGASVPEIKAHPQAGMFDMWRGVPDHPNWTFNPWEVGLSKVDDTN